MSAPLEGAFGARIVASLKAMDADVAQALADLGIDDYRTRFSAVLRLIDAHGPLTVGAISDAMHYTHSAASQTVTEMARRELVALVPGPDDARQRVVDMTAKARALMPAVDAEWDATARAVAELGAELSAPLEVIARELVEALGRRSFRERIGDAAASLPRSKHRTILMGRRRA